MKQKPKDFYIYLHRRATDGKVFYVGKGYGRRYKSKSRNKHWHNIVNKHGYKVEIYLDGLQEWYAFELEKEIISFYGRENLCNLTDGGEGPSNPSDETRIKMSMSHVGKKLPMCQRIKISESNKGRKISDEAKQKSSNSQKGKKKSESTKLNMSIAAKGRKASEETKRKLSELRKGRKLKPVPEDRKKLISIGVSEYYRKLKENKDQFVLF